MTIKSLLALKEKCKKQKDAWFKNHNKLLEKCIHPGRYVKKIGVYHDDTLGNNGETIYHRECSICKQWIED